MSPTVSPATIATFDLYVAGFLMVHGHVPRIVPVDGRSRFDFPPTAQDAMEAFDRGEQVSAALYADALRRLKKLMFSKTPHTTNAANTTNEVTHDTRRYPS